MSAPSFRELVESDDEVDPEEAAARTTCGRCGSTHWLSLDATYGKLCSQCDDELESYRESHPFDREGSDTKVPW